MYIIFSIFYCIKKALDSVEYLGLLPHIPKGFWIENEKMRHVFFHTFLIFCIIIPDRPKISTVSYGSFLFLILKTVCFS